MYIMNCRSGENFSQGKLVPYGNIEISPSASILNYGQGLFEGLKAYRKENGEILLFRPDQNALRMQMGAKRLYMPSPSVQQFIDAVKQMVLANKHWVPPHGKGTLYLRPLLMGTGSVFGIAPAPEYTFLIFASPIANHYKGQSSFNLFINDEVHRACPGGGGDVKSITNYAPVFEAVNQAKANGYSDILFLDASTGKYIEEVSSCNIFIVKGNVISTPTLKGTILPGITRKSVLEIALDLGYQVKECDISVEELMDAEEVFTSGTAVIITPVSSVTYNEKKVEYKRGEDTVSYKLRILLTGIQTGILEDNKGWTLPVD
ncbi:branched-chain-amino-acid aminotransferase 2, chloroplastic-like [Carica papaya]|uniref:branched-chain-amino-acid aminotransferase 2, chloroplastic-like n=1 Tax=Carica papaya TaxID=3649 RepID=UPI000B8C8AC3|nr:branched-chain-amino-acid aminotransferase 2, chloroplastic-like [Carica papaya]